MSINTNIYGTSEQWIDSSFNRYITNKNKVAYFAANASRLENGVSANKLSYSAPIDKSLSYCGLGEESALSHIGYIYKVDNVYGLQEWQDNFVTNFAFFQQNSTNIDMTPTREMCKFNNNEIYKYLAWQATQSSYNKNKYLQPYTLINPKTLVLCIYVRATNNNATSDIEVDLSTYMSSYKTSHPRIICAYVSAFFNNQAWTEANPYRTISGDTETSLNGNLRTLSYGRLDNYKCEGKNFDIYSYFLNDCTIFGSSSRAETLIYDDKMLFVMATENCKSHVHTYLTGGDNDYLNVYIEYFDGVEEEILKTVACFGLYFTPSASVATSGKLTNNNMYIGLLDENGIGHGQYLRGADTINAPQNEFTDMNQSGYDYTKEVDKTKYDNTTYFNYTLSSNAFTKMYVLTDSELSALANELYTAVHQAPSGEEIERYNQSVFLTQNPIDCIVSLKQFPLELPFSVSQNIKLGSYTCTTTGAPLLYPTGIYSFIFSKSLDNTVYPVNGKTFLDYEPYTKCELSIPFCGTVEIPVSYIYDYDTITVQLVIDYITGACTAYIISNGITIESIQGSCAISLPVNGLQSATLDSQIHSAATARDKSALTNGLGLIGGAASLIIGIATGGAGLAVAGGLAAVASAANMITQDKNIEYDLQHMQVPLKQIGSASGAIAQSYDMRCKMRITRPKISADYDAEVYANTIGFACLINTTVDTLSGLTVGDINLDGVAASDVEKQLIKNAFAGGVIL